MGTRVTFLGPPILQVESEKLLTRNEVMRSLLGHLGRDRFHSFRGFEVPLVCGKGSTQRSCSTETGCTSTDTPCFFRKVTKAAVDSVRPTCTCTDGEISCAVQVPRPDPPGCFDDRIGGRVPPNSAWTVEQSFPQEMCVCFDSQINCTVRNGTGCTNKKGHLDKWREPQIIKETA